MSQTWKMICCMSAPGPEDRDVTVITAIIYYIPVAAAIEVYVPSIRSCTPINLRLVPMPTLAQLQQIAEERVAGYHELRNLPTPRSVRLEFRVPREDELIPAEPPRAERFASSFGYTLQGFGHIDPGYVRSPGGRLPGTEPVECPRNWFSEH